MPWNLASFKRNRASSWVGIIPTLAVLCDKTWFRGSKVVVVGEGQINLADIGFNNRTESFY